MFFLFWIQKLSAECQSAGHSGVLVPYKCDLTNEEEILAMFAAIKEQHKGVDVCINNAGLAHPESLLNGKTSGWKNMLDVRAQCLYFRSEYNQMWFKDKIFWPLIWRQCSTVYSLLHGTLEYKRAIINVINACDKSIRHQYIQVPLLLSLLVLIVFVIQKKYIIFKCQTIVKYPKYINKIPDNL